VAFHRVTSIFLPLFTFSPLPTAFSTFRTLAHPYPARAVFQAVLRHTDFDFQQFPWLFTAYLRSFYPCNQFPPSTPHFRHFGLSHTLTQHALYSRQSFDVQTSISNSLRDLLPRYFDLSILIPLFSLSNRIFDIRTRARR
jgi:hypothetical protein